MVEIAASSRERAHSSAGMRARRNTDAAAACDAIRAAIIRAGWSKTARESGVDRAALHRAFPPKRGDKMPSFVTVLAVADALGLSVTVAQKAEPA